MNREYYTGSGDQFQDQFGKLFPELQEEVFNNNENDIISRNDLMVKNITFVTTEACNLACTYCFTGDTLVTMNDYTTKKIKDIEIGDKILGFKEYPTNFIGSSSVIESIVEQKYTRKAAVINIKFTNGIINVTEDHPILIFRRNKYTYVSAKTLKKNDVCLRFNPTSKKIEKTIVLSITNNNGKVDVYNIGTSTKTYIANEICVHNCYESHKTPRIMTRDVAKKAIDCIFDEEKMNGYLNYKKHKAVIIEFIGGEPFLNIDVMEFIAEYFLYKATELNHPWKSHYMFSVTTNGTLLLKDDRVKNWIDKYKNRLSIGITIDGDKKLHDSCRIYHDGRGSYDDVVEAVKYAIDEFNMDNTKVTFAPENISKINTAIPHLFNLGLTDIHANCVYEDVWKPGDDKELYDQLKQLADYIIDNDLYKDHYCSIFDESIGKSMEPTDNNNWCGGDGSMLAISVDGKFFPCIRYMRYAMTGTYDREEMIIGNVEKGVESKDKNKYLIQLSGITRKSQSTEECFNCSVARGCSWCTAFNYLVFGTPNKRATFICIMHKARVAANVYFWNKLYRKIGLKNRFKLHLSKEDCLKFISENEYDALIKLQEDD